MKKPASVQALEELGRVKLSKHFFMRDFLYSEISQIEGIPNIPDYPDRAIEAGRGLCENLLEPLQDARKPETNYDLSQADFYQLFAYGHKYRINTGTPKLVLIYPSWSGLKQALPAFDYGQGMSLWALPFDLDGDRLLDADFAGIPLVGKRTDQVTVQVSDQAYAAAIAR